MDSIIKSIYEGKTLTEGEGRTLFEAIFEGKVAPVALAGILTALKMRGEKPEEIAGAAAAMRGAALPVPTALRASTFPRRQPLPPRPRVFLSPSTATAAFPRVPGLQTFSRPLALTSRQRLKKAQSF